MSRKPTDDKDSRRVFDEHFDFNVDDDIDYDFERGIDSLGKNVSRTMKQRQNSGRDIQTTRNGNTTRDTQATRVPQPKRSAQQRSSQRRPINREPYYEEDYYEDDGFKELKKSKRYKKSIIKEQDARQNAKQNKEIMRVTYVFIVLFVAMISYLVYINFTKRDELMANSNNTLVSAMSDSVVRGKIISADGKVLAETVTDENGNEFRQYNYGRIFAHVVGTSAINKSGLEASAEYNLLSSDANIVDNVMDQLEGKKNAGNNVITTLDADLQQIAYEAMGGRDGAVVAIEPSTGKILCELSGPDYDPNTLTEDYYDIVEAEGNKQLLNQATQGLFTPGSIFKIFTTLAYMKEKGTTEGYNYNCTGSIELGNSTLSCYGGESHGNVDLAQSFINSCNSSFANLAQQISSAAITGICNKMLFNTSLPTDILHEKSTFSLSDDANAWVKGATAIGQGNTLVTPFHMAAVTSAIANGGVLMRPYLVSEIQDAKGNTVSRKLPSSYGSIMEPAEAAYLQELMTKVVSEGTGFKAGGLGFTVAGKTGTAEVEGKGNNAWFIGYAPAENPQIAIAVLVENAETSSAYVAVPIAAQILYNYMYR